MKKQTVLITGAASGIGLAMAKAFAHDNYQVVLCDLDSDKLLQETAQIQQAGQVAFSIACDITQESEIVLAIDRTVQRFGSIEVLINNAGLQYVSLVEEFPTEKFEQLLKVMLLGPFLLTKHIFPMMKAQGFGRIINMASINGLVGFAGKAAYNSAKHGLIGLTKVTALEGAAFNITVNALCPGYVETQLLKNQLNDLGIINKKGAGQVLEEVIFPLVPTGKLINVAEIARYALFIAAADSCSITGQAIVIDGGYTAR